MEAYDIAVEKELLLGAALKLICAWCGKVMREGEEPASHGICPECLENERKQI
jgi:hypothetical protein